MNLTKLQISNLRHVPVTDLRKEHRIELIESPKNAIDALLNGNACKTYKEAVSWLAERYDCNTYRSPPKPLSKQERAITAVASQQLAALGADNYRITLMHPTDPTINLGKRKDEERFFTPSEILQPEFIRMLNAKNYADRYNVFITPFSNTHDFFLIDDVTKATGSAMRELGYEFCVIAESSPENYQCIIKTEKSDYSKEVLNAFFRSINASYGDKNICAQIHPFRLCGFQNMKPKHEVNGRRPFVNLIEKTGVCSTIAAAELRLMHDSMASEKSTTIKKTPRTGATQTAVTAVGKPCLLNADSYTDEASQLAANVKNNYIKKHGISCDLSSLDFAVAVALVEAGHDEIDIEKAMFDVLDIERKRSPEQYLTRTITAAQSVARTQSLSPC